MGRADTTGPRILVACERTQAVTAALRKKGYNAWSCDLQDCAGEYPQYHVKGDALEEAYSGKYIMLIGHPPCTFVAGSSVQWLSHPDDKALHFDDRRPHPRYPNRRQDRQDSIDFVKALYDAPIPLVAIENPVGCLSTLWRKPDQIIQPYMFGDEATKTTCLWLKGLPLLKATNVVGKGGRVYFASGKSHPAWYAAALKNAKSKEDRQNIRSATFPGIAEAIADQWGPYAALQHAGIL